MFSSLEKGERFNSVLCISCIRTLSPYNFCAQYSIVLLLKRFLFLSTLLPIVPSKHAALILLTLLKIVPLLFVQCSSFGSFKSILRKDHTFIGVHTETWVSLFFLCNAIKSLSWAVENLEF